MLLIKVLSSTYLVCLMNYVYGYYGLKFFGIKNSETSIFEKIAVGIFTLALFSLIINFFNPIDQLINNTFLLIFIILTFFLFKSKSLNKRILINLFLISFLSILLIAFSKFQEDFPWYSLPYISLLNFDKISFGISNVQFRYGHISILQYSSSILPNILINKEFISLPNLIIFASFGLWILSQLIFNKDLKKIPDLYFYLFFLSIFIFTKFTRFSEYGNDVPAHILVLFTIYNFIKFQNVKNSTYKKTIFKKILIFSTFAVLQKIQYLFIVLFPIYLIIKNKNLVYKNLLIIFCCIFISSTWLIKNFINTSCFIYPSEITCVKSVSWSPLNKNNHAYPTSVYNASSAWAKGWPDQIGKKLNYEEYLRNFNWVNTWLNNHGVLIIKKLFPYLLISTLFLIYYNLKIPIKRNEILLKIKKNFSIIIILIITLLIWFNAYPMFRYNTAFIISLISILFSCCVLKINKKLIFTTKTFVIISFVFLISKNLIRILNDYSQNPLMPDIYSKSEFTKFNYGSFEAIIKPNNGGCFYTSIICSHHGHLNNLEIKKLSKYKFYINKNY